jgi:FtsH-binding integral membrane protein
MFQLIILAAIIIPLVAICKKTGLNPAFSVLGILVFIGLIIFGLKLGRSPWPALESKEGA